MQPVTPITEPGFMSRLQLAHPPDHALLGVVANGAGVDQDDVGALRIRRPRRSPAATSVPSISSESLTFIWQP